MTGRIQVLSMPALLRGATARTRLVRVARKTLTEIGALAKTGIRERLSNDHDVRGPLYRGRVDRGIARNAVTTSQVRSSGATTLAIEVFVQPPSDRYWPVLEDGRSPGRRPPPHAPILAWLLRTDKGRRLLASALESYSARTKRKIGRAEFAALFAPVVARAIGRKGTPGLQPFGKTARSLNQGLARSILAKNLAEVAR